MSESVLLFLVGLILGGGLCSAVTVVVMTWWGKDDWLEGYKAGLDEAASLVRKLLSR